MHPVRDCPAAPCDAKPCLRFCALPCHRPALPSPCPAIALRPAQTHNVTPPPPSINFGRLERVKVASMAEHVVLQAALDGCVVAPPWAHSHGIQHDRPQCTLL